MELNKAYYLNSFHLFLFTFLKYGQKKKYKFDYMKLTLYFYWLWLNGSWLRNEELVWGHGIWPQGQVPVVQLNSLETSDQSLPCPGISFLSNREVGRNITEGSSQASKVLWLWHELPNFYSLMSSRVFQRSSEGAGVHSLGQTACVHIPACKLPPVWPGAGCRTSPLDLGFSICEMDKITVPVSQGQLGESMSSCLQRFRP